MRLWTLHPRYLDAQGLVAAWREALLARKVLAGDTTGYRHHPQLTRFRAEPDPLGAIGSFLKGLAEEAERRGYRFDIAKIPPATRTDQIPETTGQLLYEREHLLAKLRVRAPDWEACLGGVAMPDAHPVFRIIPGEVRAWEKR